MPEPAIPTGHALIRLEDLAELLARQPVGAMPEPAGPAAASWAALGEAVGLIAARVHGIEGTGLSGDIPAGSVTAALVILAAALLALLPPDRRVMLLRDLGALAVTEAGR